jgi:hypothetical protein
MNMTTDLPAPLAKALKAETTGERVTWVGQPDPRRTFWFTTPIWLFGVPWTIFSLGMFSALTAGALFGKPVPDTLGSWGAVAVLIGAIFLIPFVAVGFGMIITPFWVHRKAKHTVYAITDKRLVIVTEGRSRKVQSVEPAAMQAFTRTEKRDGSGSLKITLGFKKDSDGDTVETHETLSYVPGVRRAEQLLQELRQQQKV